MVIYSKAHANDVIKEWEEDQREVAEEIIKKYGEPDETTSTRLIWYRRDRWKETIVSKEGHLHNFPFPHLDIVESITEYRVPMEKCSDLDKFDGSVTIRRTQGLISARCHDELANFLALNLSDDIITGKKTVEEARKAYVDAMIDYRAGKPTPIMNELLFRPQSNTADSDIAVTSTEELKKSAEKIKASVEC